MYQVIITDDETRQRSYFYSYGVVEGNITTEELPPYQDINKVRSCYWDSDNSTWVYDPDKYAEICLDQQKQKEESEKAQALAEAIPTNEELCAALLELAANQSDLMKAVQELANQIVAMEGGK